MSTDKEDDGVKVLKDADAKLIKRIMVNISANLYEHMTASATLGKPKSQKGHF